MLSLLQNILATLVMVNDACSANLEKLLLLP